MVLIGIRKWKFQRRLKTQPNFIMSNVLSRVPADVRSVVVVSLADRARCINGLMESIELQERRVSEDSKALLREVTLLGAELIRLKEDLRHGVWIDWLAEHCPTLSIDRAQRCMAIANHWEEMKDLPEVLTIRAALLFCRDARAVERGVPAAAGSRFPASVEGEGKCWKWCTYALRNGVDDWSDETHDKLTENIIKVAQASPRFRHKLTHRLATAYPVKESLRGVQTL